jgi:poly(hydroxyalkanoate) depolymerase family esterase
MAFNGAFRRALESVGLLKRSSLSKSLDADDAGQTTPATRDGLPQDGPPQVGSRQERPNTAKVMPGEFVDRAYSNAAGTRAYKLYVPRSYAGQPMPLLVMLHGCTQDPDDFAAGTRMNQLADNQGFLVVYPAQSSAANDAKCWNWFTENNQVRERGEPSLIAGITREVASEYAVDPRRIYVAGISAGAAMAVILGVTYPDLYAAVGAHSGLPYGAAHSAFSAFAAMQGNRASQAGGSSRSGRRSQRLTAARPSIPTIVFHGDHDTTVNAGNGSEIVEQAVARAAAEYGPLQKTVQERASANGRDYTATTYQAGPARPFVEQWVLHGARHTWSGGSSAGSYTDETGPDASAEMVRFFLNASSAIARSQPAPPAAPGR